MKNGIILAMGLTAATALVGADRAVNAFLAVEGDGVSIDDDGSIVCDRSAASSVTVSARPGWLVNGRESVSVDPKRGSGLKVTSKLGEDDGHVHVFPYDVEDVHIEDIVISASATPASQVAVYALPDTSTVVSASATHKVDKRGKHRVTTTYYPCVCGEVHDPQESVSTYEVEPDHYEWTASGAGQTVESSTWTGQMSKGLRQSISFHVTGKRDECAACTCTASTNVLVDVHELSVANDLYLGLDRTDFGRTNPVVKVAEALMDPEPTGSSAYSWIECGICSFTGRTDQATVRYFAPDPDRGSASYLAEPLTVRGTATNAEGLSASANCTTNFTVVKVDVTLSNIGKAEDEISLPPVCYIADEDGGSLSKAGLRYLYPVSVTCMPMDVPGLVGVAIQVGAKLYEITESYDGVPMMAVLAQEAYLGCEIGQKRFGIHGHSLIGNAGDEKLMAAVHRPSKAIDHALVKVVPPPPLEVSVRLDSPAEGGGWPYDPVWDDPDWRLTVDGSKAEQSAGDVDMATVIYTLSRDAKLVITDIYQSGLFPFLDDEVAWVPHCSPTEGVHTNVWGMVPNLDEGKYYAKVTATEAETWEPRSADSNKGEVIRKDYYVSSASDNMVMKEYIITDAETEALKYALGQSGMAISVATIFVGWPKALLTGLGVGTWQLTSIPSWFKGGTIVSNVSWSVERFSWKENSYVIPPSYTTSGGAEIPTALNVYASTFNMDYVKIVNNTGNDVENLVTFYSQEHTTYGTLPSFQFDGFSCVQYDSCNNWKWEPIPSAGYGLKCPQCCE